MNQPFELAAASVIGTRHRKRGQNNQDGFLVTETDDYLLALAADGCGSQPHSEVGAQLGLHAFAKAVARFAQFYRPHTANFWRSCAKHVLTKLAAQQRNFQKQWSQYLLFTLVGGLVTDQQAEFFVWGDGILSVNDALFEVYETSDAPPYPAYQLQDNWQTKSLDGLGLEVLVELPTADLNQFMCATDGCLDLIKSAGNNLPGKKAVVPDLDTLFTRERLFNNPDGLRRFLFVANREVTRLDNSKSQLNREMGLLPDDTTLILGRRSS